MPGLVAGRGGEKGRRNKPNSPYKSRPQGSTVPAASAPGSGAVGAGKSPRRRAGMAATDASPEPRM